MVAKRKKVVTSDAIEEKLEYIGLDLDNIPKELMKTRRLNFKPIKGYDEKQHKQYRFLNVSEIEILLTPSNRLDDLKDKYEKARPIGMYLDTEDKENILRHTTFMSMLKKIELSEIQAIEKEQELLSRRLPFKIKYNRNYLWQIYYSESTDRYFMLVPTEDTEYSTFFYLLKRKIENRKDDKIFVPISYVDYECNLLKKSELRDLENYLWMFTKDYPSIYEVYDKKGNPSIQIIGESQVYGKVKTLYKIVFETSKEAMKYYKLLKALFILQTELPRYYNFTTNIENEDELSIYLGNTKIGYENLAEFVLEQYIKSITLKEKAQNDIENLEKKLSDLKKESTELENEYFAKEKQISTFLECKKSFFGKVKYYFKFGKKNSKKDDEEKNEKSKKGKQEEKKKEEENIEDVLPKIEKKVYELENRRYTLDELVVSYKELEILENNQKNTVLDINAMKLKNKNLKKKLENATLYIDEINEHKKSIFEFWKYSNKDEVMALEEGEEEVCTTKIEKTFEYDEDFESFGVKADKFQRIKFTDSELDSSFIATTELLDLINKTYRKDVEGKDFSDAVRELKEKKLGIDDDEDFDIFGTMSKNSKKERTLGNKIHREAPRDKYDILDIRKGSRGLELKKSIVTVIKDIKKAIKKNALDEDMYVYKAMSDELNLNDLQAFSLNEANEVNEYIQKNKLKRKNNLYRIKLPKGTNFIAFSNIIFYNNQNMTLPVGMQQSDKILIDLPSLDLKEVNTKVIGKAYLEDENNDFSKIIVKNIVVHELECSKKEEEKN